MTNTDNSLGVLGLGKRATHFYLEQLESRGLPHCLVETDFDNDINPYLPNNVHILDGKLRTELDKFEGANAILIPNITLHETLDRIDPDGSRYPVVHAVRQSIRVLRELGAESITLLGSAYSMSAPYFREQFEDAGIEVNLPSEVDREVIDILRQKIYTGREDRVNLQSYQAALEKYADQGPVVIACTELSLVLEEQEGVIDMARVSLEQAKSALTNHKSSGG